MFREVGVLNSDQASADSVEVLSATARVEWLCGRRIVAYTATGAARNTYCLLFDRAEQIILNWPDGQPLLMMMDFLSGNASTTPYARERGRSLNQLRTELPVAMSMLMSRTVQASFAQLAMRAFQKPNRTIAVHFTREEGITWLKKIGKIT